MSPTQRLIDATFELVRRADVSLDMRPEFRRAIANAYSAACQLNEQPETQAAELDAPLVLNFRPEFRGDHP